MEKHIIVGTAGHIDHGKTTLIRALTGSDTDRLKEEKKRGISIDLGFANFKISESKNVGIIDVPGHEKFLKNMLAGVAGMDLVLLVVSAEEGVMPQTREHLDILNLIGIKKGIIVVTKADKVEEDFLEIVKEDILEEVKGTFMQESEIMTVDSITGRGIGELIQKIDEMTDSFETKNVDVSPRLFVDRAFSIKGFGTVVTGTLIEGTLSLDQEVYIYPEKIPTKVRGIQVHSKETNKAYAGQRVALNLSNIALSQIKRGDILSGSKESPISMMIDAKITVLHSSSKDLDHWDRVRVYHGAREIIGRIVPLESSILKRGESGFVQIRLEEALACKEMDHIVIRLYSPMETVGGGIILDPSPKKHNINNEGVIDSLTLKEEGSLTDKIESIILENKLLTPNKLQQLSGINDSMLEEHLRLLQEEGKLITISNFFIHEKSLNEIFSAVNEHLSAFHRKYPYRKGVNKEELRNKINAEMKPKEFDMILQKQLERDQIDLEGNMVLKKGFSINYQGEALTVKNTIEKYYKGNYTPATMEKVAGNDSMKLEILNSLLGDTLIFIGDETAYSKEIVEEFKEKILSFIDENGQIALKDFKDMFGLSRKYMITIFEYFDREKVTKRSGDFRIKY